MVTALNDDVDDEESGELEKVFDAPLIVAVR